MRSGSSLALLMLLAAAVLSGCGDSDKPTAPGSTQPPEDPATSLRAEREAESAALWLSGALAAPESLTQIIRADLKAIRTGFRDEYPIVDSLWFDPPWMPGQIDVGFHESVCEEIREGSYHDWDELNTEFGLSAIRAYWWPWESCSIILTFGSMLHPARLAEFYRPLRGIWYAEAPGKVGDSPNVYPWEVDGVRTYLFRNAWGDCPCGCMHNEYLYFRILPSGPAFVGFYGGGEAPEWWQEAHPAEEAYWTSAYGEP